MVLAPVPAILRSVPALTNVGLPEFRVKAAPSPCRSKVAPTALLNAPPLQATFPLLQVPEPPFNIVPPCSVLAPAVLIVIAPFAARIKPDPAVPNEPAVHKNNPGTCTVLLPVRLPPLKIKFVG